MVSGNLVLVRLFRLCLMVLSYVGFELCWLCFSESQVDELVYEVFWLVVYELAFFCFRPG